jgi:hypothetical protein
MNPLNMIDFASPQDLDRLGSGVARQCCFCLLEIENVEAYPISGGFCMCLKCKNEIDDVYGSIGLD